MGNYGQSWGQASMTNEIHGKCHCNNLSFRLSTDVANEDIRARECDCSFCRLHGAMNWSDPKGFVTIRIADEGQLQKYRFGLRTADFLICRVCGAYLGAVLSEDDANWSTVNLRLTSLSVSSAPASFGHEDTGGRVERRKRLWTPTSIVGSV